MRIRLLAPRKNRLPANLTEVHQWIRLQLTSTKARTEKIEVATSLHLGLETDLAYIAWQEDIPFTVFLSCNDQDLFWDTETKKRFEFLKEKSNLIIQSYYGPYRKDCIKAQRKSMDNWFLETAPESKLLLVREKRLNDIQFSRMKTANSYECSVKTFNLHLMK